MSTYSCGEQYSVSFSMVCCCLGSRIRCWNLLVVLSYFLTWVISSTSRKFSVKTFGALFCILAENQWTPETPGDDKRWGLSASVVLLPFRANKIPVPTTCISVSKQNDPLVCNFPTNFVVPPPQHTGCVCQFTFVFDKDNFILNAGKILCIHRIVQEPQIDQMIQVCSDLLDISVVERNYSGHGVNELSDFQRQKKKKKKKKTWSRHVAPWSRPTTAVVWRFCLSIPFAGVCLLSFPGAGLCMTKPSDWKTDPALMENVKYWR